MDLKSKSRTWVGNIYHKFETMCQEVDDFVTKDPVKYVENQVHTVGESVKKIYSNVMHDFGPPLGDGKQTKAQAVSQKQNDATGTSSRSIAGFKEKPTHASERQLSEELDTVDLRSCDSSEVDSLRRANPPPYADFPQSKECDSHREEGSDADFQETKMVVEKDVGAEDYLGTCDLSYPKDVNSCELLSYRREQHLLSENVESPEDRNCSVPSEISNNQDERSSILAEFSPRNVVEDVRLRTSQKDETACNSTGVSEKLETWFSSEQGGDTSFCKNSENVVMEEHPACEHVSCLEDKNSCLLSCIKNQIPVANDLSSLEGKVLSLSSSIDEDHKCTVKAEESSSVRAENLPKLPLISTNEDRKVTSLENFLPETSVNGEWLRVFLEEERVLDRTHSSAEAGTDLSFDSYYSCMLSELGLEENGLVHKHALTKHLGCPEDSGGLSLCSRKLHSEIDGFNSPKDETSSESPLISGAEDHTSSTANNFSSITSVHDEGLRPFCKDEAAYTSFSDVLSTEPSHLVSSNISWVHNVAESEASSSSCYNAVNQMPASQWTASSAEILDDSAVDIADMETIDLSDKANLEGSCVIVDNKLLYTASCRPRNFRSYKKLIQEVFASRKRRIKEYEQLPILYGDIDAETSLHSEKHILPHMESASKNSQKCNTGESEWELL